MSSEDIRAPPPYAYRHTHTHTQYKWHPQRGGRSFGWHRNAFAARSSDSFFFYRKNEHFLQKNKNRLLTMEHLNKCAYIPRENGQLETNTWKFSLSHMAKFLELLFECSMNYAKVFRAKAMYSRWRFVWQYFHLTISLVMCRVFCLLAGCQQHTHTHTLISCGCKRPTYVWSYSFRIHKCVRCCGKLWLCIQFLRWLDTV